MDPTLQKSFTTATKPHQVLETVREKTSTDNGRHHVKKKNYIKEKLKFIIQGSFSLKYLQHTCQQ